MCILLHLKRKSLETAKCRMLHGKIEEEALVCRESLGTKQLGM
jgi:hypothetical protein